MKKVITYGTFDLFHIGHLKIFQRAIKYGDELIVGVSTDHFNQIKGKKTIVPYDQRAEIVSNIKCVSKVIPENSWDQKRDDIIKYNIDTLVMGDDWKGKFDSLKDICNVVYLERTSDVSSSLIKTSLKRFITTDLEDIQKAIDVMNILLNDLK